MSRRVPRRHREPMHVDIGGVKGAIAPIVGKQPPDTPRMGTRRQSSQLRQVWGNLL